MLTKGFKAAEKYSLKCLKEVKSKLPRRESERRDHPLGRHSDNLTAIETRVSLLNMTFMKYVDSNLCCFFPGKVIDEIYTVLRKIKQTKNLSRSCEVLQELRDISSMAMEYFDEKIVPTLKSPVSPLRWNTSPNNIFSSGSGLSLSVRYSDSLSPLGTPLCRLPIQQPASLPSARPKLSAFRSLMQPGSKSAKKPPAKASKLVRDLKRQADSYKTEVESQNKKILELDRRMDSMNEIISQQNARLADMSRRLMENTSQFTADLDSQDKTVSGGAGVGCGTLSVEVPPVGSVSMAACSSAQTQPNAEASPGCRGARKRGRSSDSEENKETGKRSKKDSN